jgi:hypothetical protein
VNFRRICMATYVTVPQSVQRSSTQRPSLRQAMKRRFSPVAGTGNEILYLRNVQDPWYLNQRTAVRLHCVQRRSTRRQMLSFSANSVKNSGKSVEYWLFLRSLTSESGRMPDPRQWCSDNVLNLAHSAVTTAHAIKIWQQNSERGVDRRMLSGVST